ncbi:hypothetical protein LX32DRAFT_654578 [Colletotrichum zoysiae]|uniref:Heterokaryon incompatibility domain-containing protein n=1 Tax=Colletotrichum zoysiae TaxID=1216348 RepID=A0AAD9HCN9_9PEZI|nr:hypothetical protein LX32DRAFT_654578 [Colletotrichum zoysiae]
MPGNGTQAPEPACWVCFDLDRDALSVPDDSNASTRIRVLKREFKCLAKAAKKGCQTCYAIKVGIVLMFGLDPTKPRLGFSPCVAHIELTDVVSVAVFATYTNPQGNLVPTQVSFDLSTKPGEPSPCPAFGPANAVTQNLHSRRRQKMMREWIDECTASHPTCRALLCHGVQACAPRRYLDLGKNPRNGVKLVDTSASPGSYVAIIHAVAGPLPAPYSLTTLDNLEDRQRRIDWWQVPVALQEALAVANEQGLRYAWIPDFCVLHGDVEDANWHLDREDAIFRHAHFTIALSDSTDLRLSNFRPARTGSTADGGDGADERKASSTVRISHHGRTYPIQVRKNMTWSHWYRAERLLLQPLATKADLNSLELLKMGLFLHAPSFQRMLLSPRVLHMHRSEMVWECLEGSACECGVERSFNAHTRSSRSSQSSQQQRPKGVFHAKGYVRDLGRVLQLYMDLPLSQPRQRLAHIAGMLRHTSQVTGKRYCAAILAGSPAELAEALLWNLGMKLARTKALYVAKSHRCHTPRIPTWSWASMVLADNEEIQSAASLMPGANLCSFVPSPCFHYWGAGYKPAPGSSGDGLLASEYQLEVSANVMRGRVRAPVEKFSAWGDALHLLFTPETGPVNIPYSPMVFQVDCQDFFTSVISSQTPVNLYFMSLGEMALKDYAATVTNICGDDAFRVDVGLVLRRAPRHHSLGFERVGVFAIPSGIYYPADFDVQRLVLV